MEDNNNMTLPLEEADNNITESPVSSVNIPTTTSATWTTWNISVSVPVCT